MRDLAGNGLDGAFSGAFPSGDGRRGVTFEAFVRPEGVTAKRRRK